MWTGKGVENQIFCGRHKWMTPYKRNRAKGFRTVIGDKQSRDRCTEFRKILRIKLRIGSKSFGLWKTVIPIYDLCLFLCLFVSVTLVLCLSVFLFLSPSLWHSFDVSELAIELDSEESALVNKLVPGASDIIRVNEL